MTTVDVLANDGAGDAAVDPATLQIVTQPSSGVLTVTSDGMVAVDLTGGVTAAGGLLAGAYESCDVDGVCVEAPINIQAS